MKKHVFGLLIFGFIVGAAAIVYTVFNVPEVISFSAPAEYSTKMPESCWHLKKESSASNSKGLFIRQAVYNVPTKRFDAELAVSGDASVIALHFFSKSNEGTNYIETVQIGNGVENGQIEISSTGFDWLNSRKSSENFFVIAEVSSEQTYIEADNQPTFDFNKAVAITINYGK